MKKNGGIIKNWRIHKLSHSQEQVDKIFPGRNLTPRVLSGVVVNDPIGRWDTGNTMRSSLIVKYDKVKGVVETKNTLYKLQGKGNNKDSAFPEMGDGILNVYW